MNKQVGENRTRNKDTQKRCERKAHMREKRSHIHTSFSNTLRFGVCQWIVVVFFFHAFGSGQGAYGWSWNSHIYFLAMNFVAVNLMVCSIGILRSVCVLFVFSTRSFCSSFCVCLISIRLPVFFSFSLSLSCLCCVYFDVHSDHLALIN